MEIIVGKYAGFCNGVRNAIEKVEEELNKNSIVYCLGELVHNKQVIETFEDKGLKIVKLITEVPNGSKMIIRAHGEPEKTYEIAKEKNIEIIDTTCGNVKLIHNKVKKASRDNFIIIIGEKKHPEVIGTLGFAGENSYVIEDETDILDCYIEYEKTDFNKIYVVAQTTFSSQKFDELEKEIYTNFIEADVVVDKTICNATEIRQKECAQIAKDVDAMVVIGGKNSANTRKLIDISKQLCQKTYGIETIKDLEKQAFSDCKKIGIMAGASTPKNIIEEVEKMFI